MMMNIRGLVMDDPKHTVHLQTSEFASSGSSNVPQLIRPQIPKPETWPSPTVYLTPYEAA
jgi:hypothetical protein